MDELTCSNPDCQVAETGKCVEGLEIDDCPYQRKNADVDGAPEIEVVDSAVEDDERTLKEIERGEVPITSGKILTIDEAEIILRAGPVRVMVLVGPVNSGKTTLGLSLYTAFQNEAFGPWGFGGSLTLPAFEERCHYARPESGKLIPDTLHTSIDEGLGFLHLVLHSENTHRIGLLISDRSGEFYTRVANSQEDCTDLHEFSRADYILFLIDGKELASDARHGVKNDAKMLVDSLLDGGVLTKAHRIAIVLTKYDLVLSSDFTERIESDFNQLVENLRERFGPSLLELKSFRIAARPESDIVKARLGLLDLLGETFRPKPRSVFVSSNDISNDRSFFRFR